jgi:hypothetical protein
MGFPVVDDTFVAFVEDLQRRHFLDVTGVLDLATLTAWQGEAPEPPTAQKKGQMADSAMGIRGRVLVATGPACDVPPEVDHLVVPAAAVGDWRRRGVTTQIWPAHLLSMEPASGQVLTLRHTKARWLIVMRAIWKAWGPRIFGVMEELSLELSSSGLSWAVFEGHRPRLVSKEQKPALRCARRFTGVFPTIAPQQEPDLAARQSMAEWYRFAGIGWARVCPGLRLGPATTARSLAVYREWLKERSSPVELVWDQDGLGQTQAAYLNDQPSRLVLLESLRLKAKRSATKPRRKRKTGPKGPHKKSTRIRRMARRIAEKAQAEAAE